MWILLAGVFVSCQKDVLKSVDDVCSVMDDDVFKEYCLKSFDSDGDGILSMEEAAAVELIIINNSPNLVSLKGIEYFTNLPTCPAEATNLPAWMSLKTDS